MAKPLDAVQEADALVVMTEWKNYKSPNLRAVREAMRQPLVLDGRNLSEPWAMARRRRERRRTAEHRNVWNKHRGLAKRRDSVTLAVRRPTESRQMQIKKLLISLAAIAVAPAFAQAIGTVGSVNGVATVTTSSGGTTLAAGTPVMHGARIVTTSASSVTLSLNNGCTVNVPPGHGVTLLSTMSCQQAQAAVTPVTPVASAAPATAVMGQGALRSADPAVLVWGAAIAGMVIWHAVDGDDERPVSGR